MNKSKLYFSFIIFLLISFLFTSMHAETLHASSIKVPISIRIEAESATINDDCVEIVNDSKLSDDKGVAIKENSTEAIDGEREVADVVVNLNLPKGEYVLSTYAFTDAAGAEKMRKATSKYQSLYMRLQIDNERPTKRVVYVPWNRPRQVSGKFYLQGGSQQLKLWLPKGVRLDYINLDTYIPPKVPEKVSNYTPKYTPPSSHPRLWVNEHSLELVKNRVNKGENIEYWKKVQNSAQTPFEVEYVENHEVGYNKSLETAAKNKAFYYLITNNKKIGEEAVDLMENYLSRVEFGNILDITREIGRAIYTASLVYDWCYDLMSISQREVLYKNLMRLAEDMEIGWPPFKQSVLTGHGSEAQLSRDLLAMSIAIYDEDPTPYHYTSYRILNELVPMRDWQYQSPRHNQGVNYAAFRSQWDMHAALLFYRMTGREVFNDNLKKLPYYWLYMRLPNGQMLRDGDGFNAGKHDEFYYWKHPNSFFLFYTYAKDPILKGEFLRQGGKIDDHVLFLLLNDPDLKVEESLNDLPLTIDFGPIIGSMIARTGWDIGMQSDDVVAEIKGGGYHFGNHQHSDAGSMQLFYRGFQVADLGVYAFYGTPYDMNFNKRSISHSMMLAVDPDEKFLNNGANDGGTRFNQRHPNSPAIAKKDPWFNNGEVLSADFGPSKKKPIYSYFSVNLKGAYSDKIEDYTRQFCFINLDNDSVPALVVLMDKMITSDASFKKYWQINSHNKPLITEEKIILENYMQNRKGSTHVQLFIPDKDNYSVELLSGDDANSSFGTMFEVPLRMKNYPETNGHRLMVTPLKPQKMDNFLTLFQVVAGENKPLDVSCIETENTYMLIFKEYVVVLNKNIEKTNSSISIQIPEKLHSSKKVIIVGLKEGMWNVERDNGSTINFDVDVLPERNTLYFQSAGGDYFISPASK